MRWASAVFAVVVAGFAAVPQMAAAALTKRVSVATHGTQANRSSDEASISADGRYVAFASGASNLVPGDTNHHEDVFVRDLRSGTTRRVSVATNNAQGNNSSGSPAISADGRFVMFVSSASNLVPGDTNQGDDVFVRDLRSGTTRRVSVANDGTQANGDSGGIQANEDSSNSAISADGRYVTFMSDASNLVAGDTNDRRDVFVRDLRLGTTRRVSVATNNAQGNQDSSGSGPAISADGRYVTFTSFASNLVHGDTNHHEDVFVRDLRSGTTRRVSVAGNNAQGYQDSYEPSISADGRYVTFTSFASHLVPGDTNRSQDVFVRDLRSGTTRRVSVATNNAQGDDQSFEPSISAGGRYVTFASFASNLALRDGKGGVFVRDLRSGTTRLVSVGTHRTQPNGYSRLPAISADARYVAFASGASNLVPDDTNHTTDVFVRDLKPGLHPPSNKFRVPRIKTHVNGTITFSQLTPARH